MRKENHKLIMYIIIIYLVAIITYKLPHDSYSIIQYIIRPIRYGNSRIYLSGIVPLFLFISGMSGLFKLERYAKKSKVWMTIFFLIIVIPFMKWTIDFARTSYHSIKNDGINSVEIIESDSSFRSNHNSLYMNIELDLKNYSNHSNEFKIRVYPPKSLRKYTGIEYYELDQQYVMGGYQSKLNIDEEILVEIDKMNWFNEFFDSKWYYDDVKYELYNDNYTVSNLVHGK